MSADPLAEKHRFVDVLDEAKRLAAFDWDSLYSRELPRWISGANRGRLVELVQALMASEDFDLPAWVGDLVAFVPDDDLAAVAKSASGARTGASAAVLATLRVQAPGLFSESGIGHSRRRAPTPICGSHHLALQLDDRIRTAQTSWSAFGRRHHPSWVLDEAPSTIRARLGSSTIDPPALVGCTRVMVVDGLSTLARDVEIERLDLQVPDIVLGDCGRGYVLHEECGRPKSSIVTEGEDPGDQRIVLGIECGLVASPGRWIRQDWGVACGRENLNRFGGVPTFIQQPDYPDCVSCGDPMQFLVQFERGIACVDGFDLVGEGVLFAFLCTACRITGWMRQQT